MTAFATGLLALFLVIGQVPMTLAQEATDTTTAPAAPPPRPVPPPADPVPTEAVPTEAVPTEAAPTDAVPTEDAAAAPPATVAAPAPAPRDPTKGAVTNLPVPRYVTLKTNEGNARRGPGLSHRVDWVFTRAGLPLRVTAEYENWRRVEDAEGVGGWVHYTLLSGVRSIMVVQDMAEFRSDPAPDATVVAQAEQGVLGKLLECTPDWCRVALDGYRGWVLKTAIWGADPGEVLP